MFVWTKIDYFTLNQRPIFFVHKASMRGPITFIFSELKVLPSFCHLNFHLKHLCILQTQNIIYWEERSQRALSIWTSLFRGWPLIRKCTKTVGLSRCYAECSLTLFFSIFITLTLMHWALCNGNPKHRLRNQNIRSFRHTTHNYVFLFEKCCSKLHCHNLRLSTMYMISNTVR